MRNGLAVGSQWVRNGQKIETNGNRWRQIEINCLQTRAPHPHPTPHTLLPTAHCLLPTAHCLLPTAYCLLPTANCPLPTVDCPLLTTVSKLPEKIKFAPAFLKNHSRFAEDGFFNPPDISSNPAFACLCGTRLP
ncbi:MAG: hypothetical protein D6765_12745 [Bacteroidetes bacterium]|nr:MAG: hypothetical protein D6765_12745 [Bacteroidota bacterium]